jgi:hypothetical protein
MKIRGEIQDRPRIEYLQKCLQIEEESSSLLALSHPHEQKTCEPDN